MTPLKQPARQSVGKSTVVATLSPVSTKKIKYRRWHSPLEIARVLAATADQLPHLGDLSDFVEHRAELTKAERKALVKALQRLARTYEAVAAKLAGRSA